MKPLYQELASLLNAIENCRDSGNHEWLTRHDVRLRELVKQHMPSGGGFDDGTTLHEESTSEKLVFATSYHHMNENGFYDGWTAHTVVVKPSLQFGFELKVTGRDRNDIKEYMHQVFHAALTTEVSK